MISAREDVMMSTPTPPEDEHTGPSPMAIGQETAGRVLAYLLAGPLTFGGLGYLAGRWLEAPWLMAIGLVAGMALSIYTIWVRYGTS